MLRAATKTKHSLTRRAQTVAGLLAAAAVLLVAGCGAGATSSGAEQSAGESVEQTLILISFDGFRWDYPELHGAPNLLRMAGEGARAEGLIPVFPSKTFPNHYSVATGLYPEHHGIVANNMFDPVWDARFSLRDRAEVENGRWWQGEPIWVTAEKQGLTAATYFWPGSEAEIAGVRPTFWKRFDDSVANPERIQQVLDWLRLPVTERPRVLTIYFSDADSDGHRFGPESAETGEEVREVDGLLGSLLAGIEELGLSSSVNVIVTSDHGMSALAPERSIVLEDAVDLEALELLESSGFLLAIPAEGREDEVLAGLDSLDHLDVYRRAEVPERLHYREHRRIPEIVGLIEEGWSVFATHDKLESARPRFAGGTHGFDNAVESMRGIFFAHGPAFLSGVEVEPFESIHIYNLMCALLGLEPAPNDGDDRLLELLRDTPGG